MKAVWKFLLALQDFQVVEMPDGARPLHVAVQGGSIALWALVDPKQPKTMRGFYLHGTGHPIGQEVGAHVGSVLMQGGALVWHVFEKAGP